ncbi:MAG: pentapeptide repeat protein [Actinomycetia bacterium]|nr:pentapeptide repeat protein [Actinomycetes bacterium]
MRWRSRKDPATTEYATALEQLGSADLDIRLGGIESLGRLMAGSRRDRRAVIDALSIFVRHRAPRSQATPGSGSAHALPPEQPTGAPRPAADVEAAMTVLNRRPARIATYRFSLRHTNLAGLELPPSPRNTTAGGLAGVDLTGADLTRARLDGVRLSEARLAGANLGGATLIGASLYQSDLSDALLEGANLTRAGLGEVSLARAWLDGADLTGAYLGSTDLTDASLAGAVLAGATLDEAFLARADLDGTDLMKVRLLTPQQLAMARLTETTKLDPKLAKHPLVIARRAACQAGLTAQERRPGGGQVGWNDGLYG